MQNLDTPTPYEQFDTAHMHLRLEGLADQCEQAFASARNLVLPPQYRRVSQIIIAGMGGSGIGAALTQAIATPHSAMPINTWRDYDLPAYAIGPQTLVIVSSRSGDTAEMLSAFDAAITRNCSVICLSTGGVLAERARRLGVPLLTFDFSYQSREAIGWLTIPLLSMLANLGIIADPAQDVEETIALIREITPRIGITCPAVRNPVKRMAGQVMDRLPIIFGAGLLAPVARRWKTTLNETAKLLAACDEMPDLNHNSVVGFTQAEAVWRKTIVIALRSNLEHPQVARRFDLTTRLMLEAGINQDTVCARGKSALAQVFSLVQFGDWMSYYAAIMAGVDPTPTDAITQLKDEMGN